MLLALGACGDSGTGLGTLRELERNRARWQGLGMDDYRYALERICFCGPVGPVRITVVDAEVSARVFVESGEAVPEGVADGYPSVDGLFEILFDAVRRDAFRIEVTYDTRTGVPLDAFIDYSENAADEELGFQVTELPTPPSALPGG